MPKTIKKRRKAVKKSTRKTARKPIVRRKKTTILKKAKKTKKAAKKPIWASHVEKMQSKIDIALKKLERDIKRKASYKVIEEDNNELLMILGECNYIVREFHEHIAGKK